MHSRRVARCSSSATIARNLDGGYGGPQDPTVLTTPDELSAALLAIGDVVIEKASTVDRTVDTPDGPRVAIDHVVRARRVD